MEAVTPIRPLPSYAWTYRPEYQFSRFSLEVDAINRVKITGAPIPFGGVKQSGIGREGSRHGLEAFTDLKYLCLDVA